MHGKTGIGLKSFFYTEEKCATVKKRTAAEFEAGNGRKK